MLSISLFPRIDSSPSNIPLSSFGTLNQPWRIIIQSNTGSTSLFYIDEWTLVGGRSNFIPDPGQRPRIGYVDTLFVVEEVDRKRVRVLNYMGQTYFDVKTWPALHVIVDDRDIIPSFMKDLLLLGVEEADWMVDIMDVHYTYEVIAPGENLSTMDVSIIFKAPRRTLFHLKFYDSLLQPTDNYLQLPQAEMLLSRMFPLQEVTRNMSMRGLVNDINARPAGSVIATAREMDTGSMRNDGMLLYTDGLQKIEVQHVSMTNPVRMYSKNVKLDEALPIEYTKPSDLTRIQLV